MVCTLSAAARDPLANRFEIDYMVCLRIAVVTVALSLGLAIPSTVAACQLCIGLPARSVADKIIDSDCVLIAGLASDDPFSFAPVEVLKGSAVPARIDLWVDSVTRRRLAANDKLGVGLARDSRSGQWHRLGVLSPEYEAVVRRLATVAADWRSEAGKVRRIEFFVPLFGHDDRQIRELAYLEVGRAPYSVIQQLGRIAPREQYVAMLEDPQYLQWRSLAILLLAQRGDAEDNRYLTKSFRDAARFRSLTNLSARAAAAIEVRGTAEIDWIEQSYLLNPERSGEELEEIVRALSVHGSVESGHLRARIVECYGVVLERWPQFAGRIAADLMRWESHQWSEELARVLVMRPALSVESQRVIRQYLRFAASKKELAIARD